VDAITTGGLEALPLAGEFLAIRRGAAVADPCHGRHVESVPESYGISAWFYDMAGGPYPR
jgi:hypothetical protein